MLPACRPRRLAPASLTGAAALLAGRLVEPCDHLVLPLLPVLPDAGDLVVRHVDPLALRRGGGGAVGGGSGTAAAGAGRRLAGAARAQLNCPHAAAGGAPLWPRQHPGLCHRAAWSRLLPGCLWRRPVHSSIAVRAAWATQPPGRGAPAACCRPPSTRPGPSVRTLPTTKGCPCKRPVQAQPRASPPRHAVHGADPGLGLHCRPLQLPLHASSRLQHKCSTTCARRPHLQVPLPPPPLLSGRRLLQPQPAAAALRWPEAVKSS